MATYKVTFPSLAQAMPSFHIDCASLEDAQQRGPSWAVEHLPDARDMEIRADGALVERWTRVGNDGGWEKTSVTVKMMKGCTQP